MGVLLVMDVLECFLHALRLQWVEFQNKVRMGVGDAGRSLAHPCCIVILTQTKKPCACSSNDSFCLPPPLPLAHASTTQFYHGDGEAFKPFHFVAAVKGLD